MRYLIYTFNLIMLLAMNFAPVYAGDEMECGDGSDCCEPGMEMDMHHDMDMGMENDMDMEHHGNLDWCDGNVWYGFMSEHGVIDPMEMDACHLLFSSGSIAILPFSDTMDEIYTDETITDAHNRLQRYASEVAGDFINNGYMVTPVVDSASYFRTYMEERHITTPEYRNNAEIYRRIPERTIEFMHEVDPDLAEQMGYGTNREIYLSPEDIVGIASGLGVDLIVRGYITRTTYLQPPANDFDEWFDRIFDIDNSKEVIQIAYYMYDGSTGEMLWNGTSDVRDRAGFPLFGSHGWRIMNFTPGNRHHDFPMDWEMLMEAHPWRNHHGGGHHNQGRNMEYMHEYDFHNPDWLNPYRNGWHDEYYRAHARWESQYYGGEPYRFEGILRGYQYLNNKTQPGYSQY